MALQSSGAISLSDIQGEFGGSNPISISEYYGADSGVPSSGAISFSNFYGTSNVPAPVAGNGYNHYYRAYTYPTSGQSSYTIATVTYSHSLSGSLRFKLQSAGANRSDGRNTYSYTVWCYWDKNGVEILSASKASCGTVSAVVSADVSVNNGDSLRFRYSKAATTTCTGTIKAWIDTANNMSPYDIIV